MNIHRKAGFMQLRSSDHCTINMQRWVELRRCQPPLSPHGYHDRHGTLREYIKTVGACLLTAAFGDIGRVPEDPFCWAEPSHPDLPLHVSA